jgi:glutamyl-tRNA(Gln) amidotransferase subunit E
VISVIDYEKLGLKAGLEIHVQLDTKHKLFCNCPTTMQEKEPIAMIKRKQHVVRSELGEVDIAAQFEYLRDRTFYYQVFKDETCLVELDEEPPHDLNQEALNIALQIALLLNCQVPNEVHVMRKTLIDGSAISGFQRTAIVGFDGCLHYKRKKVEIKHISLEEDAAGIVSKEDGKVVYRLNRLGVPLVEISTGILQGFSPKEIQEIAYLIGIICRSTGKTKRGIGSIRQDVNVSIAEGARIEIKGIQELGLISKVIEDEVKRQLSLIEIRNELKKRKVSVDEKIVDVTDIFQNTENRIIRKILERKGYVLAIKLNGFSELLKKELCPGKTFGQELNDHAVAFGVGGIIHSDENLKKYKLVNEFKKLRKKLNAKDNDCIIITAGDKESARKALQAVIDRAKQALLGVPEETRVANPDGTTKFTRPLPGAARLYPETDVPPVKISKKLIQEIKKQLPETWDKKLYRFKTKLKLSDELANQILRSEYLSLFEKIVKKIKVPPSLVASTFVSTLKDLKKREKVPIEKITDEHFIQLFRLVEKKKLVKEAIPDILKKIAKEPEKSVEEFVVKTLPLEEVEKIVDRIVKMKRSYIEKKGERAVKGIMGLAMKELRGRVSGEIVSKIVVRKVKSILKKA